MKKCVILLFLIVISFANAEPILKFQNEDIQSGETILATINTTGKFTKQIESSNLVFYKGRKKTIFEHDVIYYDGIHYVFIYANRDGEFEIRIENILYKENDTLKSSNIIKPFNITTNIKIDEETNETITEILEIRPGAVYFPKDTYIKLFNKGTIPLELKYGKEKIIIEPLTTKKIELEPQEKFSLFEVEGYKDFSIPIIYPTLEDEFVSPIIKSDLKADPDFFVSELFVDVKETEFIQIFNLGDSDITDLEIMTDIEYIRTGKLENMVGRQIQNLSVKIDAEAAGHFEGVINITYFSNNESNYLKIPVSIYALPKGTNETEFEVLDDSCDNLNGQVCKKGSICEEDADQRFTSDGKYCCFGECIETKTGSSADSDYGWIIAVVILAALGGYGYYMYKKQKNLTPKKPSERLKESVAGYKKRMAVKPKSTLRVKGNLQKS
ncbi:hypothetical protein KAS08_01595 [Candidatus Pacearchaeota archaeon]|nr:hypothetical protein [Candidatus Pacearchaeota archaeon]